GQHAVLQVKRRGADQYRARAQGRGRAVPRASAEPGMSGMMARSREPKGHTVARRGLMLVLSSPSGAGKTTLSRRLLDADPTVALSVSVTTRKQRPGEVDGRDYHFIDAARFEAMVAKGELLEWAQVFGHRYGTPRARVEETLAQGRDVLFDI